MQQPKRLHREQNFETGEVKAHFEMGDPIRVFNIPFTKKKVDEILNNEHPIGPDSINVTNAEDVLFYGYISGLRRSSGFRCASYSYEQFVEPEWKKFVELATRQGGPSGIPLRV